MSLTKTRLIPKGGTVTYAVPNVIQLLRLQAGFDWFNADHKANLHLMSARALEIWETNHSVWELKIESEHFSDLSSLLADAKNTNLMIDVVLDIMYNRVTEDEKKP